ncbi:MAG: isocitrate dehydrogenase, NAD-dependent [Monoraphidium minutum]|nr:MAG: isocitrate dehydrogenase, NAD-dependent [Monoraphidium minutum]
MLGNVFQQTAPVLGQVAAACVGAFSRHQGAARGLLTYMPKPGSGKTNTVTLIPGDGIGPEVTDSVVQIVDALEAPIVWERFDGMSGALPDGSPRIEVPKEVLDSIRKNGVCLKGTLFTTLSKKNTSTQSLNVQLRKDLDLVVNLVHGFSIPGLKTRHDDLDIVVIRENLEGEYSGLEHEVVEGVVESLKVITEEKSMRIAEYAFEFAYLNNRQRVTAVHKANIMKKGDGMFLKACQTIAKKYPNIEYTEMIVDNTCMQLVSKPDQFDVMVAPNLYGNLVANVVAGLCGGNGIVPGGNIGKDVAIFEQGARAVSSELAGKGVANPTALTLSTSMMLRHLGLHSFSDRLEAAVLDVYQTGDKASLTPDVGGTGSTGSMTAAIISRLE